MLVMAYGTGDSARYECHNVWVPSAGGKAPSSTRCYAIYVRVVRFVGTHLAVSMSEATVVDRFGYWDLGATHACYYKQGLSLT